MIPTPLVERDISLAVELVRQIGMHRACQSLGVTSTELALAMAGEPSPYARKISFWLEDAVLRVRSRKGQEVT
jgi:hypothetical protein